MALTAHEKLALDAARLARVRAHAPYSGKQVGAAVITTAGQIFAACNVENPDSSLRVCAERNAIAGAIAAGQRDFSAIVVIAPDGRFWPPCELCRGVIREFVANPRLILATADGRLHVADLDELPTTPFSRDGEGSAP